MKLGSILAEGAVILGVALALGTTVHLLRPDYKQRIPFVGKYPDALKVPPRKTEAPPGGEMAKTSTLPAARETASGSPSSGTGAPAAGAAAAPGTGSPASAGGPQVTAVQIPLPPERPAGEKSPATRPPEPSGAATPAAGPVREVLFDEILALHGSEEAPFFDARRSANYEKGHIPGARSFSVWEADVDRKISDLLNELPLDLAIVIYCGGGDCNDSHMLADKLKLAGYMDLRIFKGGFAEWTARKMPVEEGEGPGGSK